MTIVLAAAFALWSALVDEHGVLTRAIDRAEAEPTTENLASFVAVLEAHLDREELSVIPVLLSPRP